MKLKHVITIVCMLLIVSCAKDSKKGDTAQTLDISKSSWMIVNLDGQTQFARNPTIHIDASQNKISGSTSCNKYFGQLSLDDNRFKASNIGSTKMACKDLDTENSFVKNIALVTSYEVVEGELHLLSENGKTLMECTSIKE